MGSLGETKLHSIDTPQPPFPHPTPLSLLSLTIVFMILQRVIFGISVMGAFLFNINSLRSICGLTIPPPQSYI